MPEHHSDAGSDDIPSVRLVVLNFNGGTDVIRCIEHLLRLDWPSDRLEVVVVDNASTDGSPEAIHDRFPEVTMLRSPTNRGFPANNLAMADLDAVDLVGLVNDDAFVDRDFLRPLARALADDPGLGAACPKMLLTGRYQPVRIEVEPGTRLEEPDAVVDAGWLRPDDLLDARPLATSGSTRLYLPVHPDLPPTTRVQTDHGALPATVEGPPVDLIANVGNTLVHGWYGADRGLHQPDEGQFDRPADVFAWCGGAVLLSARYLRDVGVFDERLFLYYEDLDLAWRGRSRGWRYRTVPSAVVRHRLGATTGVGSDLFRFQTERNRLVVLVKNAPAATAAGAAVRHLLASFSYLRRDVVGRLLRRQRPSLALAGVRLRAFGGFLRLLPHAVRERRRIDARASLTHAARIADLDA